MLRAVTVLPEPDSPTMASTSPGVTDRVTFFTAWTSPPSVEKVTSSPSMSRMLFARLAVLSEPAALSEPSVLLSFTFSFITWPPRSH